MPLGALIWVGRSRSHIEVEVDSVRVVPRSFSVTLLLASVLVTLQGCAGGNKPANPQQATTKAQQSAATGDLEFPPTEGEQAQQQLPKKRELLNQTAVGEDKGLDGMTPTNSGLQYRDDAVGQGQVAQAGQVVVVHYTGWLTDGTKFDSSYDHGKPFEFPLGGGQVIRGWDEGVAGMKVGGKRRLFVPPELGYGARDMGQIPPNSALVFDVELLGIK